MDVPWQAYKTGRPTETSFTFACVSVTAALDLVASIGMRTDLRIDGCGRGRGWASMAVAGTQGIAAVRFAPLARWGIGSLLVVGAIDWNSLGHRGWLAVYLMSHTTLHTQGYDTWVRCGIPVTSRAAMTYRP